jgi:hypothetical protein
VEGGEPSSAPNDEISGRKYQIRQIENTRTAGLGNE